MSFKVIKQSLKKLSVFKQRMITSTATYSPGFGIRGASSEQTEYNSVFGSITIVFPSFLLAQSFSDRLLFCNKPLQNINRALNGFKLETYKLKTNSFDQHKLCLANLLFMKLECARAVHLVDFQMSSRFRSIRYVISELVECVRFL